MQWVLFSVFCSLSSCLHPVVHQILPCPPFNYLYRQPIVIFHKSATAANPPRVGQSDAEGWRIGLDYAAFGVIVRNANLAVIATDARASSNDTVATLSAGGPGPASPLIFSTYQRTCICSAQLEALLGKYPLILIASGIFTLVAGFGSQATKKMAAFYARQST
jgi:hypothetical protein